MLDFKREKVSGMLAAHSEAVPFRIYWIDACAWSYLKVVEGDLGGPMTNNAGAFRTIEEAKEAAEAMEVESDDAR